MKKNLFPIGKVIKPHGVKGKVKIEYYGADLPGFSLYREILIEDEQGRLESYEILESTPQPPRLIIRLKGIDKMEQAESLAGREIFAKKEALLELEEGEYYWMDILGLEVQTQEGKRIGKVKEIFPTRANDVYVVEGRRGEILIPATEEVIQEIDTQKGVIKVVRKKGLWEDEDEI